VLGKAQRNYREAGVKKLSAARMLKKFTDLYINFELFKKMFYPFFQNVVY